MQRLNFTLDGATVSLLESMAERYYGGNKSLMVRAALESLATHIGYGGWTVAGYTPVQIDSTVECHSCHASYQPGDVLSRPIFERSTGADVLPALPDDNWLDCPSCAEGHAAHANEPEQTHESSLEQR